MQFEVGWPLSPPNSNTFFQRLPKRGFSLLPYNLYNSGCYCREEAGAFKCLRVSVGFPTGVTLVNSGSCFPHREVKQQAEKLSQSYDSLMLMRSGRHLHTVTSENLADL